MTRKLIIAAIISLGLIGSVASAEDDPTSLSYISYLERYASVQPADGQETIEAAINMPLVTGDRIDLARDARMEIVLADGNTVWLNEYSTLSLDSVALSRDVRADRTVLFLADGNMIIELPQGIPQEHRVRVDSSRHTIYLTSPGIYRVDVLASGKIWVEVWDGLAAAASPAGEIPLRGGTTAEIGDGPITAVQARMTNRDDFSRWVQSVRGRQQPTEAIHVDARYSHQASQLNSYGTWIHIDATDSWGWQPAVSTGWSPYTSGRWYWTPTGWSWLSYEPWGWLPYHYGSWSYYNSCGWVWGWGATWSPAWVYWSSWPGYVGWCPVGAYSSWWVGVGWGWGGLYWGGGSSHSGHHNGHGGGGSYGYAPGRGPYTGRPGGMRGVGVSSRRPASASDIILNMEGRTSASALRGRGWSAVPTSDFSSRNLSRSVRPAADFLRAGRTDKVDAIISAKPLITDSPRRARPAEALRTAFQRVESRSNADLSRIVARDSSLSREDALRLGRPTPARDVVALDSPSSRNTAAPGRGSTESSSRARAATATSSSQGSHLRSSSVSSTSRPSRETLPNAYHSSISRTSSGRSSVDSSRNIPSSSTRPSSISGRNSSSAPGDTVSSSSGRGSNLGSSSSPSSRTIPSNSLSSRALPSTNSRQNNVSSTRSGNSSTRSGGSGSTISSSPRGSSSSIASPGRSHSPTVIPGSSYSGRSSSRSYGSSSSHSRSRSSSVNSYRSSSPSRSYNRSTPSSSTSRSYSPSRSSSSSPRSSSSYGRSPSTSHSSSSSQSSSRPTSRSSSNTRSSASTSRPSSSSTSSSSHSSSSRSSSSHSNSVSKSHRR